MTETPTIMAGALPARAQTVCLNVVIVADNCSTPAAERQGRECMTSWDRTGSRLDGSRKQASNSDSAIGAAT
jgi:hypothetical protein